jgi:hypothetical protein
VNLLALTASLMVTIAPTALYAYSDHELHAIYLQMERMKLIHCSMPEKHLVEQYKACTGGTCDASWVAEAKDGKCTDALRFEHVGDAKPKIILNGKSFRARAVALPGATPKP